MSSHLKGTSTPRFDTLYWCIFCTHPHWKQCKAHNYCWRRLGCCLGMEGRSFLTSSKQPPTTCSHCTGTKLCSSDRTSLTFMLFYLYCYKMHALEWGILFENHPGWNHTGLGSSRICKHGALGGNISFFFFFAGVETCVIAPPSRTCAVLLFPPTCSLDTKQKRSLPALKQVKGEMSKYAQSVFPINKCQFDLPPFSTDRHISLAWILAQMNLLLKLTSAILIPEIKYKE